MKHNKSFWYAASLQNQFSHISHFEPKFSVNLQMSRALGRFRRWTLDGSDCIFMGDVLTAECWIIDRRWTASTVSLRPRMCRRLPSELLREINQLCKARSGRHTWNKFLFGASSRKIQVSQYLQTVFIVQLQKKWNKSCSHKHFAELFKILSEHLF